MCVCVRVCVCVAGSAMERLTVFCSTLPDFQEWVEHLQPYIKGGSPVGTTLKVQTMRHGAARHSTAREHLTPYNKGTLIAFYQTLIIL